MVEQLRLFGFPDNFNIPVKESLAHDVFGNTVPVAVVTAISRRVVSKVFLKKDFVDKKPISSSVQSDLF